MLINLLNQINTLLFLGDKEKLYDINNSISLEDFSFGPDLIEVNSSNSLLEKNLLSDVSLTEKSQTTQEIQNEENIQEVREYREDSVLFNLQNMEPSKSFPS